MATIIGFFSSSCLILSVGVLGLGFWDPNFRLEPLPAWLVLMSFGAAGALLHTALLNLERRTHVLEQERAHKSEKHFLRP